MLHFLDNGPCDAGYESFIVTSDTTLDLGGLFNAIRNERPHDNHGKLYVRAGVIPASVSSHDIRYAYDDGVFHLDRNGRRDKACRLMPDDILEKSVIRVTANSCQGRTDYFINLAP